MKKALVFLTAITSTFFAYGEQLMPTVKYHLNFSNENLHCIASVNDLFAGQSLDNPNPIQFTVNIGPYLENGKNNLSIEIASLALKDGIEDLSPNSQCQLTISKDTPTAHIDYVTVIGSADEHLKPTGKKSPDYEGKEGVFKVTENYYKEDSYLYHIERDFIVEGLPEWAWTKADRFEETAENMAKLRQAYQEMWDLLNRKDEKGIKEKTKISFREKELAEGYKEGVWYNTFGFKEAFKEGVGAMPFKWEDYQFESFKEGRLVRLSDGGLSPLVVMDKNGENILRYNPYFSLINGELVITR